MHHGVTMPSFQVSVEELITRLLAYRSFWGNSIRRKSLLALHRKAWGKLVCQVLLTKLEQDFGSTQLNPKPFEVFSGTGARGSDAFFLPIKTFMSH